MSASRIFETFKRPATKDEIAAHLADEAITELEALRKGREDQPHTPQEQEIMQRLAVLMIGPRQRAVVPVVIKRMPQMAMLLERNAGRLASLPVCEACKGSGDSEEIAAMSAFGPHLYWPCRACKGNPQPGVIEAIDGRQWSFQMRNVTYDGVDARGMIDGGFIASGMTVLFTGSDDGVAQRIQVIT